MTVQVQVVVMMMEELVRVAKKTMIMMRVTIRRTMRRGLTRI